MYFRLIYHNVQDMSENIWFKKNIHSNQKYKALATCYHRVIKNKHMIGKFYIDWRIGNSCVHAIYAYGHRAIDFLI